MADDEKLKKPYPPRRNPQQYRPTPGVQKAIQTFGVRDLREILVKKRQEQGESQGEKRPESKSVKLPPPDPSYNYLKDPTRDKPRSPQKKIESEKQFERPIARDRETSSRQHRYRDDKNSNRNQHTVLQENEDRHQENKENNGNVQEKGVLKKSQNPSQSDGVARKELRFSDSSMVEGQRQFSNTGRHSFQDRNARRGGGIPRKDREKIIENPVNIKIELSTATGQRSCTLDENTKIPDIKHVPDKIYPKHLKGGFRGSRGNFRGRNRGRGTFRGRGAASYKGRGREHRASGESHNNSFNMDELQNNLPKTEKENVLLVENGNAQPVNSTFDKNNQEGDNQTNEDSEANLEHYDEYEHDNEEYNDANENYDDEFSTEFYSEYHDDSLEHAQNLDNSQSSRNVSETEQYDQGTSDMIDPNLKATITITSSKFQDGDVKRSIEVQPKNNVEDREISNQESAKEKRGNKE